MTSNFFAALDDSGDEGPAPVAIKKETKKQPAKKAVVEPSKPDQRARPDKHDRNTKFGRGGRGPVRDGKREFDRRSGTGRGKEIKKGGGGAHNWGSDKNDARQAVGHVDEEAQENAGGAVVATTTNDESTPPPAPVVDNTVSYEDYVKAKKDAANPLLAPVKVREASTNEFSGKTAAVAVETDFLVMGGAKHKRTKAKKDVAKPTIEVGFRVDHANNDDDGGRGGRGGRGRGDGRGRGGRGEGRGGRGEGRGGRGEGRGGRGRGEGRGGGRGGRDGGRGGRGGRGAGRGEGRGGRGAGRGGGRGGRGGGVNPMDESAFPSL